MRFFLLKTKKIMRSVVRISACGPWAFYYFNDSTYVTYAIFEAQNFFLFNLLT